MSGIPKFVKISDLLQSSTLADSDSFVILKVSGSNFETKRVTFSQIKEYVVAPIGESPDVNISNLQDSQLLKYNSGESVWENWSPDFLEAANVINPESDQILKYNSESGKWENWSHDFLSSASVVDPEDGQLLRFNASNSSWENWTPDFLKSEDQVEVSSFSAGLGGATAISTDSVETEEEAAIFLANTTLGPTINEINDLLEIGSKREWLLDQMYGSYDANSEYSEWDASGDALKLKTGWFGKVALHFKMPSGYISGNFSQSYPGFYVTHRTLLTAFLRNNPVSGDIGSLNPSSNTRKDQRKSLLCKVVWILNKLIPVSVPGGGFEEYSDTFPIVDWHGVLARHAFNNYADLLEEVAYNVSMAKMLTHLRNQKSDGSGRQPDENFGREIMQLFSIGLYALNIDGTYKLDENGNKIETYDQFDILESSKVFTGLTRWDRPNSEYYDPTKESIMRGGGTGLEGISRTSFLTDNQVIYGIAKPGGRVKKGRTYRIYEVGGVNFTSLGSPDNNVGTEFVATRDGDKNFDNGKVEEKTIYPEGVIPRLKHYLPWYETGEKNFPNVGIVIPEGTDPETNIRMMVEGLVNHPNCAPNVCKNLIKLATTSNPSPGYVARVASVFRDNGKGVAGDMSAVWIAIFTDPEANLSFRSSGYKGRILDGFEAYSKIVRSLDGSSRTTSSLPEITTYIDGTELNPATGVLSNFLPSQLGSWPYNSPSVFSYYSLDYSITPAIGWGITVPEIGSLPANTLFQAVNQIEQFGIGYDPINWRTNPSVFYRVYIPDFSVALGDITNIDNVINKLDLLLCRKQLSQEKKKIIKNILSTMSSSTQDQLDLRVDLVITMLANTPEYWIN